MRHSPHVRLEWTRWRPLLVRLHFFAGILVAPFIVAICVSGLLWTFSPQLERAVYHDVLVVAPQAQSVGIDAQVAAARKAASGLALVGVQPATAPDAPTRVDFLDPGIKEAMKYRTFFVDPYTGDVLGDLVTSHGTTPLTQWFSDLHGNLHLGEPGRLYSELAADWLIVLMVGGVLLWWERVTRHRPPASRVWGRFWLPARGERPGLRRTTSWHATAGVWMTLLGVGLSVTGLFFAAGAGTTWRALTAATGQSSGSMSTWLPGQEPPKAATAPASGHGGHGAAPAATPAQPKPPRPAVPAELSLEKYLAVAAASGIVHEPRVTAPAASGQGWSVTESDSLFPTHWNAVLIDPATAQVVRTFDYAQDAPPLAQVHRYAMVFHFGRLLGAPGQALFAITMVGISASAVWGYQMWWKRRPRGSGWRPGRAPAPGAWRQAPRGKIAIGALVGLYLSLISPVFLGSVLVFLAVDSVLAERAKRREGRARLPRA